MARELQLHACKLLFVRFDGSQRSDEGMMMKPTIEIYDRLSGAVVGETPEIRKIYQIIQIAARTNHPVLIVGESGTGKEVIARAIHAASFHSRMPFRARNCATLRAIDLERELAPPAHDEPVHVDRGTLFLDQIVDLSLELQGTLLHAIQQAECGCIASEDRDRHFPRIIAASTRDLQVAVSEGAFRRDLYFRLNALSLRVPPLRERRRNIPLLVRSLIDKLSHASGRQYQLSDGASQALLTYDWPGNVRELETCLERASSFAPGPVITLMDLPIEVSGARIQTDVEFPDVRVIPLDELERRSIEETLRLVGGDRQTAARLLGIGKSTLYRKLKEYGSERTDT